MFAVSSYPVLTPVPFLPKEPLWQSVLVDPDTEYNLTGQFVDQQAAKLAWDRGVVVAFEFYEAQSQKLSGAFDGFSSSKAFQAFRYLRTTSSTSKNVSMTFRTPDKAMFMRMAIVSWSDALVPSPRNLLLTMDAKAAAARTRMLVFGRVDPNLIDGSSVWLSSVSDVFSGIEGVSVDILARTTIHRDIVLGDVLDKPNVSLLDPWKMEWPETVWNPRSMRRLDPQATVDLIKELDRRKPFDIVLIRDNDVLAMLAADEAMRAKTWAYLCNPEHGDLDEGGLVDQLAENLPVILVQTDEVRSRILTARPHIDPFKVRLLAPMAPQWDAPVRELPSNRPIRLGYSGKFSREYRALETLRAFARLRERHPNVEFRIYGDKFNAVKDEPGYMEEVKRLLAETPGIVWHGGMTRMETLEGMRGVDIGISWRLPEMDANPEMSTKILEYSLNGLPVLMSRNVVQTRLFGDEHPGFIESEDDFVEAFERITSDPELYKALSAQALAVASHFQIPKVSKRMGGLADHLVPSRSEALTEARPRGKPTLVLAGHKLNFMDPIVPHLSQTWDVVVDQWKNHTRHDEEKSRELLERADAVFCEWALGNAVWYSKNKLPGQRLVVRMHAQEVTLPFIDQMDWSAIDRIITICPHYHDDLLMRIPSFKRRANLIYNGFDVEAFDQPKTADARFTLGLIGIVPQAKGLHRAIDILEECRRFDERFTLRILGKQARDYGWMLNRPDELAYYDEINDRIEKDGLSVAVSFDGFSDDVTGWFQGVGFILSTSDAEGSHQAVAEGMASGAIPIIRPWRGADRYYPERFVFSDTVTAAKGILDFVSDARRYHEEATVCKAFTRERFEARDISQALNDVLLGKA